MEDERVWAFEESLWTADAEHYENGVDDGVLMVLPAEPYVFSGQAAKDAVKNTPRWSEVELTQRKVSRPQEGLIVVAYHARAARDGEAYEAWCTSTYRRIAHENWTVVQHQQTPPPAIGG
jgi:hypothetical protein